MSRTVKQQQWARRVAAFERSGLSRRTWCAARGLAAHSLDYWRQRLHERPARAGSRSKSLIPIVVRSSVDSPVPSSSPMVEIVLPGGVRLRAPISTDAQWLASLVRGLGAC